jgi:CBS domain containing-hemolysin-like protein
MLDRQLLALFFINAFIGQIMSAWQTVMNLISRVQLARMAEEHASVLVRRLLRMTLDSPVRQAFIVPLVIGASHVLNYFLARELGADKWEALAVAAFFVLAGQVVPKLLFTILPEWTAALGAPVYALFDILLRPLAVPLIFVLGWFGKLRQEVAGDEPRTAADVQQEVEALIDLGAREGIIHAGDRELIRGAIDFGDTIAREVMTPRTDIVALEKGAVLADLLACLVENRHTRIPLYGESLDEIIGVLYVKDIYPMIEVGAFDAPLLPHVHAPIFCPASKPLHALLKELQARKEQMAVVVDEYGGTAGLVTLEDLIEEIVGDIADSHEEALPDFLKTVAGVVSVAGSHSLVEFNEKTGWNLAAPGVETVGGWVTSSLGRIPAEGEKLKLHGHEVEILSAEPQRVLRLRLRPAGKN